MATIQPGDQAPEFRLVSDEKKEIALSSFRGQPVVLLFFPMAFTSVCTEELCTIRDDYAKYQELNAQVLGISVDSPFTLAKFKETQNLNFPLLSDFNKEASRAYGAFYEEFVLGLKGVSKRSAFVIDGEGVVQHAEVLDNAGNLPNFADIQDALHKLRAPA